jgi:hypothetical protein
VVGEYGHDKISIGKTPASLAHHAKLGRLVQSLARLERQVGRTSCNLNVRGRGACGPSHGAEQAIADRSWSPFAHENREYGHDASYSD